MSEVAPLVTVFPDHHARRISAARPMDLEELERVIRAVKPAPKKDRLPLLKLARFGEQRSKKNALRFDENVIAVYGVEGDYDGEKMPMTEAAEALSAQGLAAILYTSASHTPQRPRWRVIVPLGTPLEGTPQQLREQRRHWTGVLNAILGGVLKGESFALSQCYYFGPIAQRPEPEITRLAGVCLDQLEDAPAPVFPATTRERANGHAQGEKLGRATTVVSGGIGADRSADLLARVAKDVRAGLADYEILQKHLAHPHAHDQSDPQRAVQRCIDKARAGAHPSSGQSAEPGKENERKPIVLLSADLLAASATAPQWLLEPYLEKNSSVLLFGDLGTLKSFLALHWALEVALAGHPVVYLCAEGKGLGRRLKGWARHRWGDAWQRELGKIPFFGIERPLNLSALATVADLTAALEAGAIRPALIVVDTISRNSDGRVEASTEDATAYLNQLDALLRAEYEASVILVHHTGHQEKSRARGPYALMANTDANFRVERPDLEKLLITVTSGRMKDTESPPPFSLEACIVETGDADEAGKPVTTLILTPTSTTMPASNSKGRGRNQEKFTIALQEWLRTHAGAKHISSIEIMGICKSLKLDRRRRSEVLDTFVNSRVFTPATGGYAVHPENL